MPDWWKHNQLANMDCLEVFKSIPDCSLDINFSDPPYGLGSKTIIKPDGKPDYDKVSDFMNRWKMPDGAWWEKWFKESFRTLKFGGYCIMYGIDRQLIIPQYYATKAGFVQQSSLYWFFISSFPKSVDLSKVLDKHFGAERKKVGEKELWGHNAGSGAGSFSKNDYEGMTGEVRMDDITAPSTELAKKYDGYKYSISPFKQTNETIMIFQKPYKTNSCLHDTLAYENGDAECCCGAINIDGNRCSTNELSGKTYNNRVGSNIYGNGEGLPPRTEHGNNDGRYPAQTFIECICDEVISKDNGVVIDTKGSKLCDDTVYELGIRNGDCEAPRVRKDSVIHTNPDCPCAILDAQSGINKNNGHWSKSKITGYGKNYGGTQEYLGVGEKDTGESGCSKILHQCKFEKGEFDLYNYCPKVSKAERNAGLDGFDDEKWIQFQTGNGCSGKPNNLSKDRNTINKNNHPTLKPVSLNERILKLFKTPNPQVIFYPFAGAGSEIIGGIRAGFTDWIGAELDADYCKIAEARIKHWTNSLNTNTPIKKVQTVSAPKIENKSIKQLDW